MTHEQKERAREMGKKLQQDVKAMGGQIINLGDLYNLIEVGVISAVNKELMRLAIDCSNAMKALAKPSPEVR